MIVQVKHEAEVSRQHARYRIPARMEIDGREYDLNEWSVSGFSATGISGDLSTWSTRRHGIMSFNLDCFRLSLELEFEILAHDPTGLLRARFLSISKRHLSSLHYIINAYLSGEVVTIGDVLTIAGRDNFVKKDLDERLEEPRSGFARLRKRAGQVIGHLALVGVFALLLGFIGFKLYNRLYVVEVLAARIQGPVVVLRAPENGVFVTSETAYSATESGEFLGMIKLVGGGVASVESPCDCALLEVLSLDGAFVGRGEPLLTLMPREATLQVEAQIAFEDVARVQIGDPATVRLSDATVLKGRVRQLRASDRLADVRAATLRHSPEAAVRSATVIITTDEPIPAEMLDTVAAVTISTFWEPAPAGS